MAKMKNPKLTMTAHGEPPVPASQAAVETFLTKMPNFVHLPEGAVEEIMHDVAEAAAALAVIELGVNEYLKEPFAVMQ